MYLLSHQQLIGTKVLDIQVLQLIHGLFTSSGPGTVDTSANPSFEIAIGDTSLVLLELTIIDNNGSVGCVYIQP